MKKIIFLILLIVFIIPIFMIIQCSSETPELMANVTREDFEVYKIRRGDTLWFEFDVEEGTLYDLYMVDEYNNNVFRIMHPRGAIESVWFRVYRADKETKYPGFVYKEPSDKGGLTPEETAEPSATFFAKDDKIHVRVEGYYPEHWGKFGMALALGPEDVAKKLKESRFFELPCGFYITGNDEDVQTETKAGTVLMGGDNENDNAMKWMIENSGGGDFVIIRERGGDGYNDYIYSDLGGVDSVLTLVIDDLYQADDEMVKNTVMEAEALFFAGGDQSYYIEYYKDTLLEEALNYLINEKKIPIGGISAGCAIQGEYYFSAMNGTIQSSEALRNPYGDNVTLGTGFLENPLTKNIITDTHFDDPPRNGRLATFLARIIQDGIAEDYSNLTGIGVEGTVAVVIDENGLASVFDNNDTDYAYFYKPMKAPDVCEPGSSLDWSGDALESIRILGTENGSNVFDINNWKISEGEITHQYYINVNSGIIDDPHKPTYN